VNLTHAAARPFSFDLAQDRLARRGTGMGEAVVDYVVLRAR
jgi:hypothetical protein